MATIRFNHVDHYTEKLAKQLDNEKKNHRAFKAVFTGAGNGLVDFQNKMHAKAVAVAKEYGCNLQDGCQSPIGGGWKYDQKGNITGEKNASVLIVYIFHGAKCLKAAEKLDNYYQKLI